MFRCSKLGELTLSPRRLAWPWVALSPDRSAFALPVSPAALAIHRSDAIGHGARVELPAALATPVDEPNRSGTTSRQPGLHALALHPKGQTVAALGWHGDLPVACVLRPGAAPELVDLGPALGDMGPMAAAFTRDGEHLWLSAESRAGVAIARLRFRDFALESKVAFEAAPPPAAHELLLHPVEDAVLLTMACGQDGTFVFIARAADGKLERVANEGTSPPTTTACASTDGSSSRPRSRRTPAATTRGPSYSTTRSSSSTTLLPRPGCGRDGSGATVS